MPRIGWGRRPFRKILVAALISPGVAKCPSRSRLFISCHKVSADVVECSRHLIVRTRVDESMQLLALTAQRPA
jgi:hypothetical protein